MGNDVDGYVPVYLEDRTVVGKARVSDDGKTTTIIIEVYDGHPMSELMQENLIGFSVVHRDYDRAQDIINKEKN